MDTLNNSELSKVLGSGYWWHAPNGEWVYIEDDEDSYDDII